MDATGAETRSPTISVVIPAFNSQRFLAITVDALRRQTLSSWELIIVDDGSRDDTVRIAQQLAIDDKRITVVLQPNAGPPTARNRGFAATDPRASAVMFLDHDDVLVPDALERLAQALAEHPEAVAAHGLAQFIDGDGQLIRVAESETWTRERYALGDRGIAKWPSQAPTTLAVLIILNRIDTPGCVLIRRGAFEAVGGFDTDPQSMGSDDWDLWLRLACKGDLWLVDHVVLGYRLHGSNMSGNVKMMDRSRWHVHRKLIRLESLTDEQRTLARAGLRYARLLSAKYWLSWARASLAEGRILRGANQIRHAAAELLQFGTEAARALATGR